MTLLQQCAECWHWSSEPEAHVCDDGPVVPGDIVLVDGRAGRGRRRRRVGVVAMVLDDGLVIVDHDDDRRRGELSATSHRPTDVRVAARSARCASI